MPVTVYPEITIVWPEPGLIDLDRLKKKRICVDIDGVVCEYNFPAMINNFFGVNMSSTAIYAYDLADVLGVAPALINLMFQEQVYGKPNFVGGAIDTLREWYDRGYELVIYSDRVSYMGYAKLSQWLVDNGIPFSEIDGGKGHYHVHIDDRPEKLMGTDSEVKLLFDRPWNKRCLNVTGKLQRVYNWREVNDNVG